MKKRRLLSIVLSLCMVLALMPQMVFAEDSVYVDSMRAVGNGDGNWLNGIAWDPVADENLMAEVSPGVYEITYTDLDAFDNYKVKFAANGSLSDNWGGFYEGSGVESDAMYNSDDNITIEVPYELADVTLRLDLTNFDYATKQGAKFTITVTNKAESDFNYTESDGKVTITGYTGSGGEVIIPNKINEMDVTSIGLNAFNGCTSLTSVTIPEGVTSIGGNAFYNCTSIESVTIPEGVTSIGGAAFYNCTSLESVTIPDSVTSIGAEAFYNCTNLKNVTIPEGVTSIGSFAFYYCTSLESVTIPKGVTSIEKYTFINCTSLESVTFEDYSQLTEIGDVAFADCTSLKRVILPNGVTRILDAAFARCTSLESVEVPSSVSHTDWGVFNKCTSLESIFLPDKLNASDAKIPDTASQVRYRLANDEVTIIGIALGTSKTGVAIPETICGYPVVAVAVSEQSKVGEHTHKGGTATCTEKGLCSICGKEYNNLDNHTGSKVWEQDETQHKQYWNCCNAVVVDCKDHTWNSGVCSVCDYVCMHAGGEATCTSKATCKYCGEKYGEIDSSNHSLENIHAKDATVTETGNIEYWKCENCKECFLDKAGNTRIDIADTVISKLQPEIIKGIGQSITAGEKKALSFTSNAAFDDFKRVGLDGSELSGEYYEKAEGSIIITLDADYVATLPAGEHTIGIVSESGTAETTFVVKEKAATGTADDSDKDSKSDKDSVKTGDDTNLALWLALMLLSGAGITGVTAFARRKRTNE